MKNAATALLAAIFAIFTAGTALAGESYYGSLKDAPLPKTYNWSGLYGGVAVGYGWTHYDHTHDLFAAACCGGPYDATNSIGLDSDGVTGTVSLGYDREIRSRWIAGVFTDFTFGEHDDEGTIVLPGPVVEGIRLTHKHSWAIGARIGYVVRPETMVHFNAGYTRAKFEQFSLAGRGDLEKYLDGFFVGVGAVHNIRDGFSLTFDYRYSNYLSEQLGGAATPGCCSEFFDLEADNHAIRVGLLFRLSDRPMARHEPLK